MARATAVAAESPTETHYDVPPHRGLVLSGQQSALLGALGRHNVQLGHMYLGGRSVLADRSNPDRFALCAHAMREAMEKLPEYLDVSTKAQKESLKVKVREVEVSFERMLVKTNCHSATTGWNGAIDGSLGRFLRQLVAFLEWFRAHHPRRREELGGALKRLDSSKRALPAVLADLNVETWDRMRDYFQAVAHHRKSPTPEEFDSWLDALERFLLDRLMPRTFDDLAAIDAIIREGESDD